jgi:hypothetical protein
MGRELREATMSRSPLDIPHESRFALGASRSRIVVQLRVEVLVLSAVAGALALVIAGPILTQLGTIIRRFPELGGSLPFWVDFGFSWRAALFVAGLSVLAALVAGLVPALQATGGPRVRRWRFRRKGNSDRGPDVRATGARRRQGSRSSSQAAASPGIGARPLV